GAMAQYYAVPSYALVHSNGLRDDLLALVEPLAIGAHAVRRAGVGKGESVLVIGAGPIGLGVIEYACIAGGRVIVLDVLEHRLKYCIDHLKDVTTLDAKDPDTIAQIRDITGGDMIDVVFDATGNLAAINNAFQYMAHGGRFVLVGLQKGSISVSHPEFHKREATLMSSRNATKEDFQRVITTLREGRVKAESYITHHLPFDGLKDSFTSLLNPASQVIKALVDF
ncbi:MAG TPA: zinc-binding dehydrogenase, partial [Chryseolinea sp.]|nr:zinc-binding dehydrogenase [Chryseolinea sp.]